MNVKSQVVYALLIAIISCGLLSAQEPFREFKVLDSHFLTKVQVFGSLLEEIKDFERYEKLAPYIMEKSIPEIQQEILNGTFTYEELTRFYLYRIYKYDRENEKSLNSVIAINEQSIEQAKMADKRLHDFVAERSKYHVIFSVYGMPILVKDNIDIAGMPTTAGAKLLEENRPESDAEVITNLRENGAIILGKTNLSEWAYYFCGDCPSGYSAIGGQTLNPYGRKTIDTGGSSSGSGVAVTANFAVAALGSETAGSIISPASQNSVVGYKPGTSLVSRGVVPISEYLDRVGPMTKNVEDNLILTEAAFNISINYGSKHKPLTDSTLKGRRIGVFKSYLKNNLYSKAIDAMKRTGAEIVELEKKEIDLNGFITLLDADMKKDLPEYFKHFANPQYRDYDISSIIAENKKDSTTYMPYGQRLFDNIEKDTTTAEQLREIKSRLLKNAQEFYSDLNDQDLDVIASINNYDAASAAVGFMDLITVPMGYDEDGKPYGMTFIQNNTSGFKKLYHIAAGFERMLKARKPPKGYE
ncbi:hypothetical protein BST97_06565 [Nonlabens spongiae]|uniref:Amidase domain-containing protein n=1 Tax=Nonlabens spongiae TaxID=331648 RepID=A0A1W6MJK0_9FLAO|nr:amidase family protein [Nonlabens spongiae]ARN77686.1 hypothetical protein BST97_06565 [Nonlabens spongiae]